MRVVLNKQNIEIDLETIKHPIDGWETTEIEVDKIYNVYAIGVRERKLEVLIDPADDCRPVWYPSDIFKIKEGTVPSTWIAQSTGDHYWSIVIGYQLIAESESHFYGLLERVPDCIDEFKEQKSIIDSKLR